MADQIRILIADDHVVVRSGLRLLLDAEPDISVVGEASNGLEAIDRAADLFPDLILMDITMPTMDGLEATRILKQNHPEMKILALTMHRTDKYFFEMLKIGASGYILKGAETDELIHAIQVAAKGEIYLYPALASKLVGDYLKRVQREGEEKDSLSPREREIVRLMADGFSSKEIADKLVISPSTVYTHRSNLMGKLGLSSRYELVRYARENGLIQ